MKNKCLFAINLHLFEGAGGEGGAGDSGTMGDTTAISLANTQQGDNSGDLSKVVYGKAAAAAKPPAAEGAKGDATAPDTVEARQKEFDELINSERYKDIYTRRTQAMIDRRFAKAKAAEAENGKLREIADMLGSKYGITDDADFTKLKAAIENDDAIWEEAAEEAGMSVEQYKKYSALKRQNAAFEAARQNDAIAQQNREKAERWYSEAQELKTKFPQFDLKAELADRNFVAAINAGVPMEMAYKGKYYDQLAGEVAHNAAQTTEKNLVDNIRAKGKRPAENGAASQNAAFTLKSDPSKFTLDDFDEIARRAARGERIVF